ncbi:DUF411 domain-containing protein [Pelagibaculum spongiae]|uniref:DUF411 domain-containing protein n=1 Tax=Pelagibaculum spongiae TaxID=2080658 RepID=UPI0019D425D7|nr:DUF411 domain-containing protein [Pelagibaculum spongiae]
MKQNGFEVKEHNVQSVHPFKKKAGLDSRLASCHTAFINGKFIEGHVPAADIKRVLKLDGVKGLAVPGMPAQSPGMAKPGETIEGFNVYAVDQDGGIKVFKSH